MMDGQVPWRCLVPFDAVAFIIGKGGANIRELSEISGAKVSISKDGETPPTLADKIVVISGLVEQKENACAQVLRKLRQMQGVNDHEPGVFVIIVPQASAPVIIGSKGAQIKAIMEQSGAEINVGRESIIGMPDQPISINGTLEQVVSAVSKLNSVLQDMADRGKLMDKDFVYRQQDANASEPEARMPDFGGQTQPRQTDLGGPTSNGPGTPNNFGGTHMSTPSTAPPPYSGEDRAERSVHLPQSDFGFGGSGPGSGCGGSCGGGLGFSQAQSQQPQPVHPREPQPQSQPQSPATAATAQAPAPVTSPSPLACFGPTASGSGAGGQTSFGGQSGQTCQTGQTSFGGQSQTGQTSFGGQSHTGQTSFGGQSQTGQTSFGGQSQSQSGQTSFGGQNSSSQVAGAGMAGMGGMGAVGMGMMNGPMAMTGPMGMGGVGTMGHLGPMGMGNLAGMGMGNPMMGGGMFASNNERAFLAALQSSGINSAQLTLLLPQNLVQNILVPRGIMAEIAQRSGAQIDLGNESPPGMRQVTLNGSMVANALASLFLQERVIQFQQMV